MKDKINFGIVGCGMISRIHADAIAAAGGRLVGVCDVRPESAARFAAERGVRAYADCGELLRDPDIDAATICTPSCFHAENAIAALNHGKHVVLEKPMALNVADCDRIIEAADRSGRLLTVISQLRFSDDVQKLRRLVADGAFGKLSLIRLSMCYWRGREYFSSSGWKGKLEFEGGGALMNQGIHGIDLMQYIFGMPRVRGGLVRTISHDIEVEDTAAALLEFPCGALGTLEASTCAYPGFTRQLALHGDRGFALLRENKLVKLRTDSESFDMSESEEAQAVCSCSSPDSISHAAHALQLKNLIAAIHGVEPLQIDAREGKKAIEIIETIYSMSSRE